MNAITDPHSIQLVSPRTHRNLEFAAEVAFSSTGESSLWVGCDDADNDGIYQDRLKKLFIM